MQRDMHKLRAVLFDIEAGNGEVDHDLNKLAVDMGLLIGLEMGSGSRKYYAVASLELTPAGREFMSLARNQAIWDVVAQRIADRVSDTSFAMWLGALQAEHKRLLDAD